MTWLIPQLVAASALALHLTGSAAPAAFVPQDIEVCAAKFNVLDPEFDSQSQLMAFMDSQARVRVTSMLPDGTIGPAGCAGTLVDEAAWGWPNSSGYQGPEWARSQRGLEIYYTKFLADGQTPALARAWANGGGWETEYLASGDRRATIVTTHENTDPQARIMYLYRPLTGPQIPIWRETTDPSTEALFPGFYSQASGSAPRWVPDQRAITLTQADISGVQQAARYFIDTKTTEVLTYDAGNKGEIWMWSAPEFGGDLVFITVVDGCCLRVYRQTGSAWTLINSFNAPSFSNLALLFSPQPQIYKGRSYVALQVGNQLKDPLSSIWVVAIDPAAPLVRQVSDPTSSAVRTEPEWLLTKQGAFIYYTQAASKGNSLRRAGTGL